MALPGWFENLLHSGTAAGLSGIPALQLSSDPDRDWFLRFLRVHFTAKSLALWPERLWSADSGARDGTGVKDHLGSLPVGCSLAASQMLLILSKAELEDAIQRHGLGWVLQEEQRLSALAQKVLLEKRVLLPMDLVDFEVRIIGDGDRLLGTRPLNLLPGEFVTALLPNRHLGEASNLLGVYVHVPGAWEGFRPIAFFKDRQLLYTFGNHWLDNFQHPSLHEGALYQLSRDSSGRWVHSIHPDHRESYHLKRTNQVDAMDVVTLSSADGRALLDVQLVLLGRTLDGVEDASPILSEISDASTQGLVSLEESGVLLQRVHFPQVMRGYDVYITEEGALTTSTPAAVASIQIRGDEATLCSRSEHVVVNQAPLAPNQSIPLRGQCDIQIGVHHLVYNDLSGVQATAWPYVGEIRRSGWKSHLPVGGRYIIGRSTTAWVRLPDVADSRNISWADESSTASVDSRTGTFARKDFYTDSIMVASEHAAVDLTEGAVLENRAKHCPVFIRRAGAVVSLLPRKKAGLHRFEVRVGDELLIGNCVFSVGGELPRGGENTSPDV